MLPQAPRYTEHCQWEVAWMTSSSIFPGLAPKRAGAWGLIWVGSTPCSLESRFVQQAKTITPPVGHQPCLLSRGSRPQSAQGWMNSWRNPNLMRSALSRFSNMMTPFQLLQREQKSRFLWGDRLLFAFESRGLVYTFKGKNKTVSFAPKGEGDHKAHKLVTELLHMGIV